MDKKAEKADENVQLLDGQLSEEAEENGSLKEVPVSQEAMETIEDKAEESIVENRVDEESPENAESLEDTQQVGQKEENGPGEVSDAKVNSFNDLGGESGVESHSEQKDLEEVVIISSIFPLGTFGLQLFAPPLSTGQRAAERCHVIRAVQRSEVDKGTSPGILKIAFVFSDLIAPPPQVCASLSQRLQEYKSENGQLEELLREEVNFCPLYFLSGTVHVL